MTSRRATQKSKFERHKPVMMNDSNILAESGSVGSLSTLESLQNCAVIDPLAECVPVQVAFRRHRLWFYELFEASLLQPPTRMGLNVATLESDTQDLPSLGYRLTMRLEK